MDHQTLAAMLGSYGEFFGAIAVVVTLGYLAFQVRQNTRSSYVTRASAVTSRLEEIQKAIICDSDLSALLARCRDPELNGLTPTDEERLQGIADLYCKLFGSVQTAHSHLEMTDAYFEGFRAEFQRIVKTYPALKPRMRVTLQHFDMKLFPVFAPAFDGCRSIICALASRSIVDEPIGPKSLSVALVEGGSALTCRSRVAKC